MAHQYRNRRLLQLEGVSARICLGFVLLLLLLLLVIERDEIVACGVARVGRLARLGLGDEEVLLSSRAATKGILIILHLLRGSMVAVLGGIAVDRRVEEVAHCGHVIRLARLRRDTTACCNRLWVQLAVHLLLLSLLTLAIFVSACFAAARAT